VSAPRFELPGGIPPEHERALIAALERYFDDRDPRPNPWAMAGRMDAVREGTLQARRGLRRPWAHGSQFARRGTEPISGRGDTA